MQIKGFFSAAVPFVTTPFSSSPLSSLFSSLRCNDHSSALQEPVPFSTACSLIQPAPGCSALVCSRLGGGPHCPSSSQMTAIVHAREGLEASPIIPVWDLSRNSLAQIIMNYNFYMSSWVYSAWPLHQRQTKLLYIQYISYLAEIQLRISVSCFHFSALYSSALRVWMCGERAVYNLMVYQPHIDVLAVLLLSNMLPYETFILLSVQNIWLLSINFGQHWFFL